MTFVAALRHDRIEALWFLDGAVNGERFLICVEEVPPNLNSSRSGIAERINSGPTDPTGYPRMPAIKRERQ
jgi:hypothetical protein